MIQLSDIKQDEFDPYYKVYLDLIDPSSKLDDILLESLTDSITFLQNINQSMEHRYAEGKWSIGQVLQHNIDTERVFAYRAMRFIRLDTTPLPGFDQDVFVDNLNDHAFAKAELIAALRQTRLSTVELFKNVTHQSLVFKGLASGNAMSARVIPFLIAGHNKHHENVISERYLS